MAHGHGELAIHLLQEHLRDAHRVAGAVVAAARSVAPCGRYRRLYRRQYGMPALFHVDLDGRAFFGDSENGPGLEAYPHLLEQLVQVWNTPEIKAFFDDLVFDQRGGTRVGFEPDAYRDILLLRSIAHDVAVVKQAA